MSRHIIYAISKIGIMAAIIMACLFAPSAYAQDTVKLSEEITIVEETPVLNSGNTAWLIVATILVLLMSIPGIALFYGGLVRQKNILSIIMQTLLIVGVVSILWVAFGYSWAFGTSFMESGNPLGAIIGGFDKAFLHGITINTLTTGDIPELTFVMFQCMFAIITPALILGAFAERIKFSGYMVFIILWVILAYFPHNITFVFMGTSFLWLGWFGFNAGSGLAADGLAANAFMVTHIATAVAAVTWMLIDWFCNKKPTTVGACTGAVAGLVAITPAAGTVDLLGAFFIGLITPVICFFMVAVVKPKFKYDDALDAFGVHGIGGIVGSILTGVFATQYITGEGGVEGALYGDWHQLWVQIVATVVSILFSAVITFVLYKIVDSLIGIRVDRRVEEEGLDIYEHGESAYNS